MKANNVNQQITHKQNVGYYSASRRKKTACYSRDGEHYADRNRSVTKDKQCMILLVWGIYSDKESRMVITRDWGEGKVKWLFNGYNFTLKDKKLWRLAAQQCECTLNYIAKNDQDNNFMYTSIKLKRDKKSMEFFQSLTK